MLYLARIIRLALVASLLSGFALPISGIAARDPACASLYRFFGPAPAAWLDTEAARIALSRAERIAAAEKTLPWNEEARLAQGEQLLELRAQITRQGNFRDDALAEWAEVLERRNLAKKILDPDPDGPDFLRLAKSYGTLAEKDRLAWVHYFGRSEHEQAYPVLEKLFRAEPSLKIREILAVLAHDRGFSLDSKLLARDIASRLSGGSAGIDNHVAARLRAINEIDLARLLKHPNENVQRLSLAGLRGRPADFLARWAEDPRVATFAKREISARRPPPPEAALRSANVNERLNAASRIDAADPAHGPALAFALQDPVAEIKLAALANLKNVSPAQTPELRRLLRSLGQTDENIRVRRLAQDLLEPYSREAYAIAPSRTWMIDAMRRKFPTHVKLPPERARDMELMLAASHVYDAPELAGAKSAADLIRQHRKFLGTIPADYEVTFLLTDPTTGFKAAIYRPTSAAREGNPALVAIGGTQTGKDILADLNWGVAQAKSPAYAKLLAHVVNELANESRPVAITGHSLGGGLAQVFGYDLARALKDQARPADLSRFRVVSWNGFGAKEALEKLGRYRAADAKDLPITSYFHPDDLVSKLGTHLGETIAIRARAGAPRGLNKLKESHVIKAVQDLFQMEHALLEAEKAAPKKDGVAIRWLEKFARVSGRAADSLLQRGGRKDALARVKLLDETRREWARQEGFKELKPGYDWLSSELGAEINSLEKLGASVPATASEPELESARNKLRRRSAPGPFFQAKVNAKSQSPLPRELSQ